MSRVEVVKARLDSKRIGSARNSIRVRYEPFYGSSLAHLKFTNNSV